eukprot:1699702-Rhodomonas_salina.3
MASTHAACEALSRCSVRNSCRVSASNSRVYGLWYTTPPHSRRESSEASRRRSSRTSGTGAVSGRRQKSNRQSIISI